MTRWCDDGGGLDHRGERPEFDLSENEGGISSNGSDSGPGESGMSDSEMDESMRNFYKPGSPSSWSRHHQSSRFGSMQSYTGPSPTRQTTKMLTAKKRIWASFQKLCPQIVLNGTSCKSG